VSRLRRVDSSRPGIRRVRHGRGFSYVDEQTGRAIDDADTRERIRALVIPPAWEDVWICPFPNGHIQAVGIDARGRRQYRYHDRWRARRDQEKFDQMTEFARRLPDLRKRTSRHLRQSGLSRDRVLAGAVQLLDRGFFRIGGEEYANENGTYGLATMKKQHVTLGPGNRLVFDYTAKGGKRRLDSIVDSQAYRLVAELKRRRAGGDELLAFKQEGRWTDVRSSDINAYIKTSTGGDFTAKDFRTWSATVLAAVAVAVTSETVESRAARKRAIGRAVGEVSAYLGNTPAVCRASYIDPRIFDLFDAGVTIAGALDGLGDVDLGEPAIHGAVEVALLDLLDQDRAGLRQAA
jgi:DNA topoisomerase-1